LRPADLDEGDEMLVALRRALVTQDSWTAVGAIPLNFPTYHPQGMVRIGEFIFLSSVRVPGNPGEREGVGYLFKIDLAGELADRTELGDGVRYHPGGIDFDGRSIWVPVAEYSPDSSSEIVRVDPDSLAVEPAFSVADHIGALAFDRRAGVLHGFTWAARGKYAWTPSGDVLAGPVRLDRSDSAFAAAYQDCQYVGSGLALCGGTTRIDGVYAGSLDLVDLANDRVERQLAVDLRPPGSERPMTHNPLFGELRSGAVRFYFAPEDDRTKVYRYDSA